MPRGPNGEYRPSDTVARMGAEARKRKGKAA